MSQPFMEAICSTLDWKTRSDASVAILEPCHFGLVEPLKVVVAGLQVKQALSEVLYFFHGVHDGIKACTEMQPCTDGFEA